MPPFEGFLSDTDLFIVALLAAAAVLYNLWDFLQYGYHASHDRLAPHPLEGLRAIASRALAALAFPHARRAARRPMMRRRPSALAVRTRREPPLQV